MSNAKQILASFYAREDIPSTPFNIKWSNGTGYHDGAVRGEHAPKLKEGEMVKSITDKGRKIVMMGTSHGGNIVVFDRYTNEDSTIVVYNSPQHVAATTGFHGSLSPEEITILLTGTPVTTD